MNKKLKLMENSLIMRIYEYVDMLFKNGYVDYDVIEKLNELTSIAYDEYNFDNR